VSRFDDRLTKELERAARPAEPTGVFDEIERRRGRRVSVRRLQTAMLATAVFASSIGGVLVLNRAFRGDGGRTSIDQVSPFPTTPKTNGLLAFANGDRVFTVAPEGGEPTPVPGVPNGAWHPAWSPDGTRIAVTVFQDTRSIWVLDADGSGAQQIATADNVSRPSWSPDGTQIAYAADTAHGSTIHIVNADGSGDHTLGSTLTGQDYFTVSFSPDGTKLLYDAGTDSGFGIFVMNADGSGVDEVGPTGHDYDPSWSPDGGQILFTRQEQGAESDIWVMDADGSHVRQLTNDGPGATNLDPIFSPDGTKVAFMAGVTGGPGALVVMDADGSHPVTVVRKDVLGLSWQAVAEATTSASPVSEEPSQDIGLAFNLCRVKALDGIDFLGDGANGTAWVGTRLADDGSCPPEFKGESVVAVDVDGDGVAESWAGPLARCIACRPFAVTDLNADGMQELVVILQYSSTTEYTLFSLERNWGGGPPQVKQVTVAEPGSLPLFRATKPVSFWAGGDEGFSSSVRCEGYPDQPVLVVTQTDQPVEGPRLRQVREARLVLQPDGTIAVIDSSQYTEPVTAPSHTFTGRACGVPFWGV
jgi:hypothetical protein